jgi:NADPH2:quinone reductase
LENGLTDNGQMRAAVYEQSGSSDVLHIADVGRPEPGPGEVRVRVSWSGVNPTDWKSRAGLTARALDTWQIPNQDGSGHIDAVGPGVDPQRVGQPVWVYLAASGQRWGTAAQWTVVPAERAVALPEGVSLELGAMFGVPAMTAYHCVFCDGPVQGTDVLVAGGAGAVGHFAIELARHGGARVVTTVSNDEKAELARAAGAHLVVNYRQPDAIAQVQAFASQFHRIVEVALGANFDLDLAVSGPRTVIVTYASEATNPVLPLRRCMTANVTLRFVLLYGVGAAALRLAADGITAAAAAGVLTELPIQHFELDEIAEAHDAVEAGALGKVLVDLR